MKSKLVNDRFWRNCHKSQWVKGIASGAPNVKVEVLDTCLGSPRVGYLHALF